MIDSIRSVCRKYNISTKNLNGDTSTIIHNIGEGIIDRSILVENPRIVMAELWKIEKAETNNILYQTKSFIDNIAEIVMTMGFEDIGDFIVCNKLIPCCMIQTTTYYKMLNDDQKIKLQNLGYGITQYKIRKSEKIREVYCLGNHPNANNKSKQFCLDNEFLNLELNVDNVCLLEELLSHINLKSCFLTMNETKLILEILNNVKNY